MKNERECYITNRYSAYYVLLHKKKKSDSQFYMPVCKSVLMYLHGSHLTDFREFRYSRFSRNSVEKRHIIFFTRIKMTDSLLL